MIKNTNILTLKDKLYMLNNETCFSMSTRSSIGYHKSDWESEVNINIPSSTIEEAQSAKTRVKSSMVGNASGIDTSFINRLMNEINLETNESIVDFILYCKNTFKTWKKRNGFKSEILESAYNILYNFYVPYKITANYIYKKTQADIVSNDTGLNEYLFSMNKLLFKEVGMTKPREASALTIYLLMKNLGLTEKDTGVLEFFIMGKKYYNKEDAAAVEKIVNRLFTGKDDALNVLDRITNDDLGSYGDNMLAFAKRGMENNYIKSKISEEVNNGSLCIGEDIFPDHEPMRLDNLLIELDKLNEEEIQDYIGKEKMITFLLEPSEIAYLRHDSKLPICKVLRKKDGFYTLTKVDNVSYLLFKTHGYNSVFGISFPPSIGGRRKLLKIKVPNNFNYEIKSLNI